MIQKLTQSKLNALIWQENDLFVAKTIELEIASQGKTKKEALKNLEEAVSLYLEDSQISPKSIRPTPRLKLAKISPQKPAQYA
jgi:predicted RNase H-like HicB family nuclease